MSWVGDPAELSVGIETSAYPDVTAFSFGAMVLCRSGDDDASIASIEPLATIGHGFEFLGALVRDVHPPYGSVISSAGFPPEGEDVGAYRGATGATIDVPCQRTPSEGLELVIGFEKVGDSGGGWEGVDMHYSAGDREYVLEIHNLMVLCPPGQNCEEYIDSVTS